MVKLSVAAVVLLCLAASAQALQRPAREDVRHVGSTLGLASAKPSKHAECAAITSEDACINHGHCHPCHRQQGDEEEEHSFHCVPLLLMGKVQEDESFTCQDIPHPSVRENDACSGLSDKASCTGSAACSWCESAAVGNSCFTKEDAAKLPPAIFACT